MTRCLCWRTLTPRAGYTDRSRLALLHLGYDGPAQGRGVDSSQPAVREPVLLRRYRSARRARHPSARGAGVARRRAICTAVSAEGRAPDRPAALRRARHHRRGATAPAGLAIRRADDADPARPLPRGCCRGLCQYAHDLLRRRADVRRRPRTRARDFWAATSTSFTARASRR